MTIVSGSVATDVWGSDAQRPARRRGKAHVVTRKLVLFKGTEFEDAFLSPFALRLLTWRLEVAYTLVSSRIADDNCNYL